MNLPRQLYRCVRPSVAKTVDYAFGSRIITRDELFSNPQSQFSVIKSGTDEQYWFERPRYVGLLPTAISAKIGECTVPAPFIIEVKNATLIGPSAMAVTNGTVLLESVLGGYERLVDASVRALFGGQLPFETRFQHPDCRHDESLFSLVGPWATEYYHWFTDYLVKVFAIETYREQTGLDPLVLIPADPPAWLLSSLSLVGVDADRLVEWSGTRAHCSRLVVGSLRRHTASTNDGYINSPAAMARLGERIRRGVDGTDTDTTRRLYVSRADALDRRVCNEDELISMLNDYGFERIVPGDHSFAEQVRRFADAEIILGPHGAGLTNMIFAGETTLIELFGSYQNACFFALAKGMGHEYVSVMCRSHESDMVVDVDAIESLLPDMVANTG